MGNAEELRLLKERVSGVAPERPIAYYVSPGGNEKDGKSLQTAFKTITKGIDVLNNLPTNKKGAILYIAPGLYIEKAGIELESDHNILRCTADTPGSIYFVGADDFYPPDGSPGIAIDNLLIISGRHNILSGFTFWDISTDYAAIFLNEKTGGQGLASQNIFKDCYFSPFAEDLMKYCVNIQGGSRNFFIRCQFNGPTTAGILLKKGYAAPTDTFIQDCDFIGTNRGIIIDGENYNTNIRRNWFTAGSRIDENMDNAIELTTLMNLGKVTAYGNYFEQSAVNDILDNKTGGTLIEMNNFNGA